MADIPTYAELDEHDKGNAERVEQYRQAHDYFLRSSVIPGLFYTDAQDILVASFCAGWRAAMAFSAQKETPDPLSSGIGG